MKDVNHVEDRIFAGDEFNGTYIVYGAIPGEVTPFACDIRISSLEETSHRELRAFRLLKRMNGKKTAPLRKDALHNEMMIVFGPEMSPLEAIEALETAARNIKERGLLIGRTEKDGDFLVERPDGKIVR